MAITDQIIRRGSNGKRILVPENKMSKYLWGPTSDRRHKVGATIDRLSGDVDFYEVASSICTPNVADRLAPPGDYTFTIDSWLEKGLKQYVKAIRWVAVSTIRSNGHAELLYRKPVVGSDRKTVAGPFKLEAGERLFIAIQREGGVSAIQYRLALDAVTTRQEPGTQLPQPTEVVKKERVVRRRPVEKPIEKKAWEMVGGESD
jgi:hypothetical protein